MTPLVVGIFVITHVQLIVSAGTPRRTRPLLTVCEDARGGTSCRLTCKTHDLNKTITFRLASKGTEFTCLKYSGVLADCSTRNERYKLQQNHATNETYLDIRNIYARFDSGDWTCQYGDVDSFPVHLHTYEYTDVISTNITLHGAEDAYSTEVKVRCTWPIPAVDLIHNGHVHPCIREDSAMADHCGDMMLKTYMYNCTLRRRSITLGADIVAQVYILHKKSKFIYKRLNFSDPALNFSSKHSFAKHQSDRTGDPLVIAAGSTTLCAVIALCVLVIILIRRHRRHNEDLNVDTANQHSNIITDNDAENGHPAVNRSLLQ